MISKIRETIEIIFKKEIFLLFLILVSGFALRVYGLNWDQGAHLHPDERMIVMVAEGLSWPVPFSWQAIFSPQSPLNPNFFAYGSLPLYLLKIFSSYLGLVTGNSLLASYENLPFVGRFISLAFDLGVVILIFKIGKRIFRAKVGLMAAVFYATFVLPIQLSHFYAVDTLLNFFIWLTLWRLIIFYEGPNFKNALKTGLFFGLSLATKISATALLAGVGTALLADLLLLGWKFLRGMEKNWWVRIRAMFFKIFRKALIQKITQRLIFMGGTIGLTTAIVFLILEPYALIDFSNFKTQILNQNQMIRDAYVFPYTLQYVGTPAYWYFLKNILLWGIGLGLGPISFLAVIYYGWGLVKRLMNPGDYDQEAKELIIVIFGLGYFLVVGRFAVKFMRYFLPLYPFLALILAREISIFLEKGKNKLRLCLFAPLLLVHSLWLLSFMTIYSRPHSRVLASQWINENVAPGSSLAIEHWDDRLPLFGDEDYSFLEMPLYEGDMLTRKWQIIESNLEKADYLILASNRLYLPLPKLADCSRFKICYPKTAEYYRKLFSEELGFRKVAEFSSYPGLKLGKWDLTIPDDGADESFTVYDHPKVIIFAKQLVLK